MTPSTTGCRLVPRRRAARRRADRGLTAEPKSLPPKWFYDAHGSALFEKITELPEYYPTRAEREILRAAAPRSPTRPGRDPHRARFRVLTQDPAAARRAEGGGDAVLLRAGDVS